MSRNTPRIYENMKRAAAKRESESLPLVIRYDIEMKAHRPALYYKPVLDDDELAVGEAK